MNHFYSAFFTSIGCFWTTFIWSRKVALWIGRQLVKQRTWVQAPALASIRLTEAFQSKNAESQPIPYTCLSTLTSWWEDKHSTSTMINEASNYYLISAFLLAAKLCHLKFMLHLFSSLLFGNPFGFVEWTNVSLSFCVRCSVETHVNAIGTQKLVVLLQKKKKQILRKKLGMTWSFSTS